MSPNRKEIDNGKGVARMSPNQNKEVANGKAVAKMSPNQNKEIDNGKEVARMSPYEIKDKQLMGSRQQVCFLPRRGGCIPNMSPSASFVQTVSMISFSFLCSIVSRDLFGK